MDHLSYITKYLMGTISVKKDILKDEKLLQKIAEVSKLAVSTFRSGNKILIAGNGGSAADAQHIAAEFVSRFLYDRPGLPCIALTTDTSMLTAIGNDYGFEKLFSRQLEAHGKEGDLFIGISTSGNSSNIITAVESCRKIGVTSIALCGNAGVLGGIADHAITVPSNFTPYIQESHICIGHLICAIVEESVFPRDQHV